MDVTSNAAWNPLLRDPTGKRAGKPRECGITMVIDKGLGLSAFKDLIETAGPYIDLIKFGFGTSPLYPPELLQKKIDLATRSQILVMPGGTFLEAAVLHDAVGDYFAAVKQLGFTAIEVSDGTIEMDRKTRSGLIQRGCSEGFTVFTEYGKKLTGATVDAAKLLETVLADIEDGARLVTVEARESGEGVGIFDENGKCRERDIETILNMLPDCKRILWEAPKKAQQVHLIRTLGAEVNLGNIFPEDAMSLETLRRGLRSDTMLEK